MLCTLKQDCTRTPAQIGQPCPDPMVVDPPQNVTYAAVPMTDPTAISDLSSACPYLNPDTPLCCGADTAAVMASNFQSLDAVFLSDCPICSVNLKVMWCEYACNPYSAYFRK